MSIKINNQNQKNQILKQVGQNIKQARVAKNITQQQLAELLNTSVNFISLIERGQSGLNIVTIINICNALQIEPNALFNKLINIKSSNNQIVNSLSLLNQNELTIIQTLINYMSSN